MSCQAAPQQQPQQQIDTRAIEIASAALTRIEAHEERCNARDEQAAASRAELKQDIRDGFARLEGTIRDLGGAVHKRISHEKDARYRLVFSVSSAAIVLLLGLVTFLFLKAAGWGLEGERR